MSRQQHFSMGFFGFSYPLAPSSYKWKQAESYFFTRTIHITSYQIQMQYFFIKKKKCNDFLKFIGNKCQITNLLDVTDFQKLIGSKCRSSFISYGLFLHLAPSSTNGGRMRECLFHFPLSWQRN